MRVIGFILLLCIFAVASYYLTISGTEVSSIAEWLQDRTGYELFLQAIIFLLIGNILLDYWRNLGPITWPSFLTFSKKSEGESSGRGGIAIIDMVNVSLMVAIAILLLLVYLDGPLARG